ncbi:hypothetical protein QR680_014789 [Steinernema hermaphroditum]|uniref:Protein asunder n=1 Tax=Steinernema hermaphroditum TaxID=289476 RepID=A0AA39ICR1_9BILA|nr:hypothetical protein QR680_014789 [Steinernema hermaphroditum]
MDRCRVAAASDPSHKTIIVLDHGPAFAQKSGFEVPCTMKSGPNQVQEGIVHKSMWTLLTEAALEFRRVVADLFPEGDKQLCYVISDTMARVITPNWIAEKGALSHDDLITALCRYNCPDPATDPSTSGIRNGLSIAVETLSEKTPLQEEASTILNNDNGEVFMKLPKIDCPKMRKSDFLKNITKRVQSNLESLRQRSPSEAEKRLKNRGSIVVFTSISSKNEVQEVAQYVADHLIDRNTLAANSDGLMLMVDHINLHIVNCFPGSVDIPNDLKDFHCPKAGVLMSVTHVLAKSGPTFTPVVQKTIMQIYDLASTTVTNIPMKEEANQGTSVNYDVELFHKKVIHSQLEEKGLLNEEHGVASWVEGTGGNLYKTVKLKWQASNAKFKSDKFPVYQGSSLATAVSVNSRPAQCLTGFVLGGKNVMLECVGKDGKLASVEANCNERFFTHFLCRDEATHTLMIQTLTITSNPALEIINANSGQSTHEAEVNAAQLKALYEKNEIKIVPKNLGIQPFFADVLLPSTAKQNWSKNSAYLPLNLKETFIFNMPDKFSEFLKIVEKDQINEADMETARSFIAEKYGESEGSEGSLGGDEVKCTEYNGVKLDSREKQYAAAFTELIKYTNNFSSPSSGHTDLMEFIANLTSAPLPYATRTSTPTRSASTSANQSPTSSRSNSPVPVQKKRRTDLGPWPKNDSVNLLQLFNEQRFRNHWLNWTDFNGRRNGVSTPADLYVGMKFDADPVREDLDKKKNSKTAAADEPME